jgi:hypothetical protein
MVNLSKVSNAIAFVGRFCLYILKKMGEAKRRRIKSPESIGKAVSVHIEKSKMTDKSAATKLTAQCQPLKAIALVR